MELVDGGFKLTYTKPLSDATLADLADKYKVRQWSYVPTSSYGGPKIGEEALDVTEATVSADRKVVTLKIAGLKPNRVVYVRSPRPFDAQDGTKLLSTEAWYTLNKLPGYVAPVSDGLYELEDGILTGGAKFDTEHAGYSGTGFVSGYGTVGASTKIDVNAAKAGDYRMALRYANGPNPFQGPKKITLIVNGTSRQITLPSTGTWPTYRLYLDTVRAQRRARTRSSSSTTRATTATSTSTPCGSRRRARRATRPRRPRWPAARTPRPSTPATAASATSAATRTQGASTTFKVTALADGEADVTLGYANGPNPFQGTKRVSLYVNGNFVKKLALPDTGAWTTYRTFNDKLVLRAGSNDISIRFDTGDDGNVNLDYLDVKQNEPIQCEPGVDPNDTFDGNALNRCRWTTILNEDPAGYSRRRRQAADQGAGRRHHRRHGQREEHRAPARADRRQLVGDDEGVDRRHRRVHPGRARRARERLRLGQGRRHAPAERRVDDGARPPERLPERADPARQRAEGHHAADVRARRPAPRPLLARRRADLDRDRRRASPLSRAAARRASASPPTTAPARRSARSRPSPSASRRTCRPRRRARRRTRPRPATRCCSTARTPRSTNWTYAGGGRFVRDGCTIKSVGGFGLLYTKQDFEAPYSLKLEWMMPGDDNSGVFVGFPDTGANTDQTSISQGEEIQIDPTDNPAQTTGAIYLEQAADAAARDAALKPPGQWNAYEIVVRDGPHHRLPERREDQRVARRRPERRPRHGPHRPADARVGRRRVLPERPRPRARRERRRTARSAGRCRRRCR